MEAFTMQDKTYKILREKIIKMDLKPGYKISINELMDTLDVGRTPLRESLKQLQKQNLIYTVPQSGTFVSKIDMVQAVHSRFVRECIEKEVMVELTAKITNKQIDALKEILDKQREEYELDDISKYHDLDNLFHQTCYIMVGKEQVWNWLTAYNTHLDRFRWLLLESETFDYNMVLKQHEGILEAIINRETDEVKFLIVNHIHFMLKAQSEIIRKHAEYFTEESINLI